MFKFTMKTLERRHYHCYVVFVIKFKHILHIFLAEFKKLKITAGIVFRFYKFNWLLKTKRHLINLRVFVLAAENSNLQYNCESV